MAPTLAIFCLAVRSTTVASATASAPGSQLSYQELALVFEMTVYENIFLGNEIRKGALVDWNETVKRASEPLAKGAST